MKKQLLILLSITALAGCKKQYTCECTIKQNVMGMTQNVNATSKTPKMKKEEAKTYCEAKASTDMGYVQQDVDCRLAE